MNATKTTQPVTLTAAGWESARRGWRASQVARYVGAASPWQVAEHFVARTYRGQRQILRINDATFALEPERRGPLVLKENPYVFTVEGDETGWDIWRTRLD
jgi:hypothetical protein